MKRTILIVDDDTEPVEFTAKSIRVKRPWWYVISANSCDEARKITDFIIPNIALIDLNLPDGNGLDLMRDLKKKYPDLCFIINTASASDDLLAKVHKLDKCSTLDKPYDVTKLISAVENIGRCGN